MIPDWKEDDFDQLLRRSLKARPEPTTTTDLAARAMAEGPMPETSARRADRHAIDWRQHVWWSRLAGVAAMMLILLVFAVGSRRVLKIWSQWEQLESSTSAADSDGSSSSDTTGTFSIDLSQTQGWMLVGLGGAAAVAVVIVIGRSLSGDASDRYFGSGTMFA